MKSVPSWVPSWIFVFCLQRKRTLIYIYCYKLQPIRNRLQYFEDMHIVWKLLKMSHLNCWILAFSTNFCPIKSDLSGNTVWQQASDFQKLAIMDHFWHFWFTFVDWKCKHSSLRSQFWMRPFLWFLNTV